MSYENASVLVLNKSWNAISVINARHALTLLFREVAKAMNPVDYTLHEFETWKDLSDCETGNGFIKSPNYRIPVPSIIVLTGFDKMFGKAVRFSRRNIFARDNYRCQYCGKKFDRHELTMDHVVPKSRGGKSTWDNIVLACVRCNSIKSDKTPEEAGMKLQRKPKKPAWLFRVSPDKVKAHDAWQQFVDKVYWNTELEGG